MALAPGTKLGPYAIVSQLGQGGMGVVYTAHDPRLDRQVAIKLLPPDLTRDDTAKQRFLQEAKAASALDHTNICTIFEVNETADGQLYLVMAHYEGETLKERIARGPLKLDDAVDIATQVGQGLSKAHEAGIVHRDIKPANLIITAEGIVKILDFGLAKLAGTEGVTQTGTAVGTVSYMSPEQARGQEVDHRTDIWSLGVVLYEMLAGEPPFTGDNLLSLAEAIRSGEPASLTRVAVSVRTAVTRALNKDAAGRYQTTAEMVEDFTVAKAPATQVTKEPEVPSVLVLPFVNRSADPGNEYFSDGLTDEVISDLAGVSALRVISRNSSMALKGIVRDTQALADELGVSHLVTGSVRRAGNALRVTAELVETATDTPIWSQKFSGTVEDVFGIQEDISRQIVSALKVRLTDTEERQVAEHPIEHPIAYDCYLRSYQMMYHWTLEAQQHADRLVDEALRIVGDSALLLAMKGQLQWNQANMNLGPADEALTRGSAFVDQALAIDPESYLAIFVRGLIAG